MTSTVSPAESVLGSSETESTNFTFIDLFAGIGGMRLGFEAAGLKCVYSVEIDKYACQTYRENFPDDIHDPQRDITVTHVDEIPEHDVLVAGFPCQPFSLAGVSKHNSLGTNHGFEHETQGTLFFDIERILKAKKPTAFLLENVKNLKSHDEGNTFKVILRKLHELGYDVSNKVIDARYVVPQHRERTYIVGFLKSITPKKYPEFKFPEFSESDSRKTIDEILEKTPDPKYTLSEHLWRYLQDYAMKHRAKGNGFGFGLIYRTDPSMITRTLSARYHKDGSEILLDEGDGRPRRLTPTECMRLMGFPEDRFRITDFKIKVSDTQLYRQFGNSVVVPVIERIANKMADHLRKM